MNKGHNSPTSGQVVAAGTLMEEDVAGVLADAGITQEELANIIAQADTLAASDQLEIHPSMLARLKGCFNVQVISVCWDIETEPEPRAKIVVRVFGVQVGSVTLDRNRREVSFYSPSPIPFVPFRITVWLSKKGWFDPIGPFCKLKLLVELDYYFGDKTVWAGTIANWCK